MQDIVNKALQKAAGRPGRRRQALDERGHAGQRPAQVAAATGGCAAADAAPPAPPRPKADPVDVCHDLAIAHGSPARSPAARQRSSATRRRAAPTRPARPSRSTGYCWLRDGAFIADAHEPRRRGRRGADAFFGWCARVDRATARDRDRRPGRRGRAAASRSTPAAIPARPATRSTARTAPRTWWDFQLDGYGTWLWALDAARRRVTADASSRTGARSSSTVRLSRRRSWDQPCYDWWEEHAEHRHISTLGAHRRRARAAPALGRSWSPSLRRRAAARPPARDPRADPRRRRARRAPDKWLGGDGRRRQPARLRRRRSGSSTPPSRRWPRRSTRVERDLARRRRVPLPRRHVLRRRRVAAARRLLGWYVASSRAASDGACAQLDWIAAQAAADG